MMSAGSAGPGAEEETCYLQEVAGEPNTVFTKNTTAAENQWQDSGKTPKKKSAATSTGTGTSSSSSTGTVVKNPFEKN